MTDLKPCPFCGSPAEICKTPWTRRLPNGDSEIGGYQYWVACTGRWEDDDREGVVCEVHPSTTHEQHQYLAIAAWNRRANV